MFQLGRSARRPAWASSSRHINVTHKTDLAVAHRHQRSHLFSSLSKNHTLSSTSYHRPSHPSLNHRRVLGDLLVVQAVSVQARLVASIDGDSRALDHGTLVHSDRCRGARDVLLACKDGKVAGRVLFDVEDAVVEGFAAEHGPGGFVSIDVL